MMTEYISWVNYPFHWFHFPVPPIAFMSWSGEKVFVEGGYVKAMSSYPVTAPSPISILIHIPVGGWWWRWFGWRGSVSSRCGPGDSFQLPDNLVQAFDLLTPQASRYQLRLTCTLTDAINLLLRRYWQGDCKSQGLWLLHICLWLSGSNKVPGHSGNS